MQVSSSSPSRRKRKSSSGKEVHPSSSGRNGEAAPRSVTESFCDETQACGIEMPGVKEEDGASVPQSQAPFSQASSMALRRESAWSTTSMPPNALASSAPSPTEKSSLQSSTVESALQQNANGVVRHVNLQELKSEQRGLYLIELLLACANSVACGNMEVTNVCLEQLSSLASLTGDSMQRVAAYFMEGLAARITSSWPGVFKALHSTQYPSTVEVLSARQVFFNVCPYLKFAFLTINQAILDSTEGEEVVHIVDLHAVDAVQWLALLQALRALPGGAPQLKITGISEKKDVLEQMGQRLAEEAERLEISFQFFPVLTKLEDVKMDMLSIKAGEAVAVSSVMRLHLLLNEEEAGPVRPPEVPTRWVQGSKERGAFRIVEGGVESGEQRNREANSPMEGDRERKRSRETTHGEDLGNNNNNTTVVKVEQRYGDSSERSADFCREKSSSSAIGTSSGGNSDAWQSTAVDKVLRVLKSLNPKVMVLVEQESDHNQSFLVERFVEALHYYCALFDSLDSTLPQHCLERVTLEKHLFGVEIKNVVACEGRQRVERHETLNKWKARLRRAGFNSFPLSYSTVTQAERLLTLFSSSGYRLLEASGCLTLAWQQTPLYSASAWHA